MDSIKTLHIIIDSIAQWEANFVQTVSSWLVPVLAILTGYIALQQFRVNRQRFLFESYEKRLQVYNAVQNHLYDIQTNGKTDFEKIREYQNSTFQAGFLFDKVVENKIEEIFKKSVEMNSFHEQLYPRIGNRGLEVGDLRTKISSEEKKLVDWHCEQIEVVKKLFKSRMRFN